MKVIEHARSDVVILEPRASITAETEHDLAEVMRRHLNDGHTHLVLDLACVPYIDSCGLGRIVQGYVTATKLGGWLKLMNVTARHQHALSVARLHEILEIYHASPHAIGA